MDGLGRRLGSLQYFETAMVPDLASDYLSLDVSTWKGSQAVGERYGIVVESHGSGNTLVIHRQAKRVPFPTRLRFDGENNIILIDRECSYHGTMNLSGSGNLAVILGGQGQLGLDATLYGGDTLVWGKRATSWGARVWVQGGTTCTISDGCLLSENISIRTTDHHSIIELSNWTQINYPADIVVGRHVWIGPNVRIGKGAIIGDGAIIAPDSVVTGTVPRTELWGGVPAKMIRTNVSWVVSHPRAEAQDVSALRQLLGDVGQ